jgi:hypothetical protein
MDRMSRWRFGVVVLLTLSVVSACEWHQILPPTARQFESLPVYQRRWAMTEACSGLTGSLPAITWVVGPDQSSLTVDSENGVAGYWTFAGNRIVLAAPETLDGPVVRHEMLHALLQAPGHPRDQFLANCAGVVLCETACITDAGPAPPADPQAVLISPESLVVTLTRLRARTMCQATSPSRSMSTIPHRIP